MVIIYEYKKLVNMKLFIRHQNVQSVDVKHIFIFILKHFEQKTERRRNTRVQNCTWKTSDLAAGSVSSAAR